jgi:predicted PurR-regulated permease PerM
MTTPSLTSSPRWTRTTKLTIVLIALAIVGLLALRFSALIGQFVIAAMLAYILNPLVAWLSHHARFSRGWAVMLTYVIVLIVATGFFTLVGVAVYNQTASLIEKLPSLVGAVGDFLSNLRTSPGSEVQIGGLHIPLATLDWNVIETQIGDTLKPLLGQGTQVAGQFALDSLNVVAWLSVTLLISIYVAIDLPRLGENLAGLAHQSGYREDFRRMSRLFSRIWNAYLRGQVILGVIVAVITSIVLAGLGVDNWLALGLFTGVLQVIPYVGPTLSAVMIIFFALFQPSNYMGLNPGAYALVVGVVTLVVQQVTGNLLLPTVVGDALNMSPLAVLISLIVGYAVAGILGVILAAPVVASLKLIVNYIWHKLLDLPPFPDSEPPPTHVTAILRRTQEFVQQIRDRKDTESST